MNKYLNKSNLKFAWWFIFNLLTTLFVVSLLGFFNGSQGEDGLDGRDGSYIPEILTQNMMEKPTGTDRETYADDLIEEGFLPIDSLEDFETYFRDDFLETDNNAQSDYLELRNFVLTTDLDFSEATENQRIPLFKGEDTLYFRGIFDGAGYTISGFESESDQEYAGFFPRVDDAIIRNVTFYEAFVSNASFSDTYGDVGVVVGYSSEELDLINVTLDSSEVQSLGNAGGLIGYTDGTTRLINSHIKDSEIAGRNSSGGLIGRSGYGDVLISMSSSVDSFINGDDLSAFTDSSEIYSEAGGFIGDVDDMGWVYVYRSFNTSKVESDTEEAGGFFGQMDNINRVFIAQSYNAGLVQAFDDNAGGMIGQLDLDFSLIIQDSFNIGTIYGYDESGGLIGYFARDNRHPESSITNVYNAGKVLGTDDSYGGFIGDQSESMLLTIQTSFSFTSFSRSNFEFNPFDSQNFPTNGSIIGEVEEVLFDQVYYYVEANNPSYAPTATNKQFDFGTVAIEDEAFFYEEDFVLSQAWNFQSIWEFTDAFDFPTLQEVEFLNPGEETELEFGLNVYGGASIDMLETEEGYTPFEFYFSDFYLGDDKDSAEDLTIEFGYLDDYYYDVEVDLENLLADIEIFYTQTGYPVPGEVFEFTPINDNYNFLYVIVTDSDGNKDFDEVASFQAQLILLEDVIAPTTTDAQVNSNFNANNVTSVFVSFTTATDNVSSHANLNYYVLISDTNEAFVDATSAFALFGQSFYKYEGEIQNEITEGIFTGNWPVTGFEFNTEYYVAIIVQDEAGNLFLYTPDTIQVID